MLPRVLSIVGGYNVSSIHRRLFPKGPIIPNNHILTQNLYNNSYYIPEIQVPNYGVHGPFGVVDSSRVQEFRALSDLAQGLRFRGGRNM